jgi:hypothetical protein
MAMAAFNHHDEGEEPYQGDATAKAQLVRLRSIN